MAVVASHLLGFFGMLLYHIKVKLSCEHTENHDIAWYNLWKLVTDKLLVDNIILPSLNCPHCQRQMGADASNFRRHQRQCQGNGKIWQCGSCLRTFPRRDNFKRHLTTLGHTAQANSGVGDATANANGPAPQVTAAAGASQQPHLTAVQPVPQWPQEQHPVHQWPQEQHPVHQWPQEQLPVEQLPMFEWAQVQHPVEWQIPEMPIPQLEIPQLPAPAQTALGVQYFDFMGYGTDFAGIDPNGINPVGINPNGIDPVGIDPNGIDPVGVDPNGVDPNGVDLNDIDFSAWLNLPDEPINQPLVETASEPLEGFVMPMAPASVPTAQPMMGFEHPIYPDPTNGLNDHVALPAVDENKEGLQANPYDEWWYPDTVYPPDLNLNMD
ncbi:hypothetical protein LTR10_016349 [Elasticomyces elasticus]|nr:hypothetical protein LTR10_016349 [Elasticomyces elasticus]KAK5028359.1 hypothetical protein LTS07_006450 [Exophiala sideris]